MQSKYTIPPPIGAVFAFYTTPKVDGIHLTATGAIADIAGLYTRHRHKKERLKKDALVVDVNTIVSLP